MNRMIAQCSAALSRAFLPLGFAARMQHGYSRADGNEVVIALGSNLGDRGQNMLHALRSLRDRGVEVLRHSALYETLPAYLAGQPNYLNAALLARTRLEPLQLLQVLKEIEASAGREEGIRFGPRPLDMDIIFYGDLELQHSKLEIPHPRWHERSFVKAPVADLYRAPPEDGNGGGHGKHPALSTNIHEAAATDQSIRDPGLLRRLQNVHQMWSNSQVSMQDAYAAGIPRTSDPREPGLPGDIMQRVMPLSARRLIPWGRRTYIMAILNATPDSFSDGGALMSSGVEGALQVARRLVREGADVLDVGGQSTRPGATLICEEEEAGRVMPLIRAMREDGALKDTLISIDTFYASVARQAIMAGADIVNDVSGGTLDPRMMPQVAELGVPYVLMHMRGDLATMQQAHNTQYGCTWREVGAELQSRADLAMATGIAAWNIILDPGIGFAKDDEGNLELMRHLGDMRQHALQGSFGPGPMLVGPSRKGFLGRLTGRKEPSQRDAATMASVFACVAGGGLADMVRVHNVEVTRDGLKVADALYRR